MSAYTFTGIYAAVCRGPRDSWFGVYQQRDQLHVVLDGVLLRTFATGPARWHRPYYDPISTLLWITYTREVGRDDHAIVLCVDPAGSRPEDGTFTDLGPVLGSNPLAWGAPDSPYAATLYRTLDSYRYVMRPLGGVDGPAQPIGIAGGTTQGIRYVTPEGVPVFCQDLRVADWGVVKAEQPAAIGPELWIAQSLDDVEGVVLRWSAGDDTGLMAGRAFDDQAPGRWPTGTTLASGRAVVASTMVNGTVRFRELPPYPLPLVAAAPPPALPVTTVPVPAWPRRLWMATFFPRADDPVGNALIVNRETVAAQTPALLRAARPLFLTSGPTDPVPDALASLIVGWWTSGADLDGLGRAVDARLASGPPHAVIAYLDARGWPGTRPAWATSSRVIPQLQAYRRAGESLVAFEAALRVDLDAVTRWAPWVGLALRFDDNYGGPPATLRTLADVLADMVIYQRLIRSYPVIHVGLFADDRGHGLRYYPELMAWAQGFVDAVPARPSRFDGWRPDADPLPVSLRAKLRQNVRLFQFSQEEQMLLLDALDAYAPPEPR